MKGFLKFLATVTAVFSAVLGALAVFDKIHNRNRIKEYLRCEVEEKEE